MKKYLVLALAIALMSVTPPLCMYNAYSEAVPDSENAPLPSDTQSDKNDDTITVFLSESKTTTEMKLRDYIIGVVAAEMPAVFEPEALSAQAAVSLTLVKYMSEDGHSDESLNGAVISTDSKKHQAYCDEETMKSRWGDSFEEYYSKLAAAVDKVMPYVITYDGKPILAAFHAISCGMTESAGNVWSTDLPYLQSVESDGDKLCNNYKTTVEFSLDEFSSIMSENGVTLSDDRTEWFKNALYSNAGTLKSIEICQKTFSGDELRSVFSLRSASITPEIDGDKVIFTVKGYGHGVGMSQYGADHLARQGLSWEEIIQHYYSGVEIQKIE